MTTAALESAASGVASADPHEARRLALRVRLGLLRAPLDPAVAEALIAELARLTVPGGLVAVRSSALCEDTADASFAGQFDTFLGIGSEADLLTAVHACWASLWSSRALRYMRAHEIDPARTAMAVLVQRMIDAEAAGGALSQTPEDELLITGTWGLGSVIAQGEVVPDRFVLRRDGAFDRVEAGRKDRLVAASLAAGPAPRAVRRDLVEAPCLGEAEAVTLGRMVLAVEAALGSPVEVEWAKDARGVHILQARPLRVETPHAEDELWRHHPGLRGQPAGVGWATGPACLVIHEHDLDHVAPGDILVTEVAGPALTAVLPRVAGVVAELGGSTSHLAALARERGIPAVLGVLGATRRIPEGATVAVDGVAGVVRWMR
jgi:pyruvate,water dikinase